MGFTNIYEDAKRANSYAQLEYPGTYYLAFRDIPALIHKHISGTQALDFGCGAGRSSRFLKNLGFQVTGVDISADMIAHAQASDLNGDYRLVDDGDLSAIEAHAFDLILAAFPFDNIPSEQHKLHLFKSLGEKLDDNGKLIVLVSTPDVYLHEWVSFTTRAFPENRLKKDGDTVKIIMLDVDDDRPVEDVLCSGKRYRELFDKARLNMLEAHYPLGNADDPFAWKSENKVAPWCLYVVGV